MSRYGTIYRNSLNPSNGNGTKRARIGNCLIRFDGMGDFRRFSRFGTVLGFVINTRNANGTKRVRIGTGMIRFRLACG